MIQFWKVRCSQGRLQICWVLHKSRTRSFRRIKRDRRKWSRTSREVSWQVWRNKRVWWTRTRSARWEGMVILPRWTAAALARAKAQAKTASLMLFKECWKRIGRTTWLRRSRATRKELGDPGLSFRGKLHKRILLARKRMTTWKVNWVGQDAKLRS